jgi:hypothetical protein
MKRVRKMMIGTNFDAAHTLALLQAAPVGEIALLDPRTNGVPVAGTAEEIVIARRCADSDGNAYTEFSDPIPLRNITSMTHTDWAASDAKVMTVTLTAGLTPTEGEIFELIFTDYNDYNYIVSPRRVYYEATAADVAAGDPSDAIKDGLIAAINADVSMPNLTAASGGVDIITVTGAAVRGGGGTNVINNFRADYEVLFDINAGTGLAGNATIATTTPPDKGCGMFREIRKMEEDHKGFKGHLNRTIYPTSVNIQYHSDPNVANGYDVLVIEFKSPQHTQTEGDVPFLQTLTVAVDEAAVLNERALDIFDDINLLR